MEFDAIIILSAFLAVLQLVRGGAGAGRCAWFGAMCPLELDDAYPALHRC